MDTPVNTKDIARWPLGRRLRERRLALGLSQQRVADAARMKRRHYSDLENGKSRTTSAELIRLARALETTRRELANGTDWDATEEHRPRSSMKTRCDWQPERRAPFAAYLYSVLRLRRATTTAGLAEIRKRTDLALVRLFLREVACQSWIEALTILMLLALGARPVWESPLRVGFRRWPVLLHDRQAGDCRHPGLELEFLGIKLLFLFQVTVHVARGGKPRLDMLVAVREPGRPNRFLVGEVDGPLHTDGRDKQRTDAHEMREARVDWAQFQDQAADPATLLCHRILKKLGIDTSDDAVAARLKKKKRGPKATSKEAARAA